jgi:hypothetical protein
MLLFAAEFAVAEDTSSLANWHAMPASENS